TADEARAAQPTRLQVILSTNPASDEQGWQRELRRSAPGLVVEGRLGPIVTVLVAPASLAALAELPLVSTVRLPRAALPEAVTAPDASLPLIRIDPAAPYQLLAVARYIDGAPVRSESLEARSEQLREESEELRILRDDVLRERRVILDNFKQDDETLKRRE